MYINPSSLLHRLHVGDVDEAKMMMTMISVLGYCCCCVDRRSVGVHDQASREKEED
jgi:hypothetical protein